MMVVFVPTLHASNRRSSSWSDLFGLGLMGGSSPSYGAGWDQLFGNALLSIAGYGGGQPDGYGAGHHGGFGYGGGHGGGFGAGGYPSFGGGYDNHGHHGHHEHVLGTHTVVTKKVGYPVPQPYPVPVERKVPYPVSYNIVDIIYSIFTSRGIWQICFCNSGPHPSARRSALSGDRLQTRGRSNRETLSIPSRQALSSCSAAPCSGSRIQAHQGALSATVPSSGSETLSRSGGPSARPPRSPPFAIARWFPRLPVAFRSHNVQHTTHHVSVTPVRQLMIRKIFVPINLYFLPNAYF